MINHPAIGLAPWPWIAPSGIIERWLHRPQVSKADHFPRGLGALGSALGHIGPGGFYGFNRWGGRYSSVNITSENHEILWCPGGQFSIFSAIFKLDGPCRGKPDIPGLAAKMDTFSGCRPCRAPKSLIVIIWEVSYRKSQSKRMMNRGTPFF